MFTVTERAHVSLLVTAAGSLVSTDIFVTTFLFILKKYNVSQRFLESPCSAKNKDILYTQ